MLKIGKRFWVMVFLCLGLLISADTFAQQTCPAGSDCVPIRYAAWCHTRGGGCGLGSPSSTCPEASGSPAGFRTYADDTAWSIQVFKACEGYVSGTASPGGPEALEDQGAWAEPISGHQRWDYSMVRADGSTRTLNSANGRSRSPYCLVGFSFFSGGNKADLCQRQRPLISPKNLGCCTSDNLGQMQGNPINTGIGNKVQLEVDYAVAGSLPLDFKRTYNSLYSPYFSSFGGRWSSNYDRAVLASLRAGQVAVTRGGGKTFFFTMNSNVGVGDADVTDRLSRTVDSVGNITGWEYLTSDDNVELYDTAGKLLSVTDRNGYSHFLMYSDVTTHHSIAPYPGLLIAVRDSWGRRIEFTYDGRSRLASFTDPAGGKVEYGYDAAGNLITRKAQDGFVRTYLYNEPEHRGSLSQPYALTGIVAEDGVRYATFKYDNQGRAVSTEHAGGVEKVAVDYAADGSATVTDAAGAARTFTFTKKYDVIKLTSIKEPCPSCVGGTATRSITLDANGFTNLSTDQAGTTIDSDRDARGLEFRRIESAN
ncbi:MAG: DUF6531 domain-containing protein, partial [Lysobacter sp.]